MFSITLPDGSQKTFHESISVLGVAESLGPRLAKAAVAGKINDRLVDTSFLINEDATLKIITEKDPEALEIIRHSTAHLLAHAVKELFPTAQVTIGPVIENGFYYDFAFEKAFSVDDLSKIEVKMQEIANDNHPVTRQEISRNDAIHFFEQLGEFYKVEIIKAIPENEILTIYHQSNFADLCRGPHVPFTGMLKAFKLTKVSGAYWRGDSNNKMLQRIYGTAWMDKKSLDNYLTLIEQAEKRDHRKIGKHLDLFHFQEEAPGMVFWHPNGWTIYKTIKEYISKKIAEYGYQEVVTPQIVDLELWKRSGHWEMFHEEMFTINTEQRQYAVKPMSCPCHVEIFKQGLKSYRDLPLRLAEFGCVHRNELTGAMHGLMRVRQLTQDDGHIFCSENQIEEEASHFIRLLPEVYKDFGFHDIKINLATRPEKRIGTDELWDHAENSLKNSLTAAGFEFEIKAGEGAFYGPKVEFHLRDCIGRSWQCGTLQLDYSQPARLQAYYIDEDSNKKHPVMLHRAILGSIERFIGILLEHHAGKLPLWLAPIQFVIMNITDKQSSYVEEITKKFNQLGFKAKSDLRNEKISFKIREHTLNFVPYLLVAGDREVQLNQVSVRTQQGADLGLFSLDSFADIVKKEIENRQ